MSQTRGSRTTTDFPPLPLMHVVVPVFNEAGNVPRLVDSFRDIVRSFSVSHQVKFLVVDDGSKDGTSDEFDRLRGGLALEVVRHAINRGPGAAFGTAFARLAGTVGPRDLVATIEGDNTCRLELLRQMYTRSQEGDGYDVVLASPYLYGGGIKNTNFYRTALSNIANLLVKEVLGLHGIMTMSSFFRLHRGDAFVRLQQTYGSAIIERRGFESMIEMLLKMAFLEFRISEVAMVLDTSRRVGKSKMKIARTGAGYLTLWKYKHRWWAQAQEGRYITGAAIGGAGGNGAGEIQPSGTSDSPVDDVPPSLVSDRIS